MKTVKGTETLDSACDQVPSSSSHNLFRFGRPRWGIQTVHQARPLFPTLSGVQPMQQSPIDS
jgi:hypothetical protein